MYAAGRAAPSSSPLSAAAAELAGTAAVGDTAVVVAALADEDDGFFSLSCGLRERLCGVAAARTWSDRPRGELREGSEEVARGLACEARAFRSCILRHFLLVFSKLVVDNFDTLRCDAQNEERIGIERRKKHRLFSLLASLFSSLALSSLPCF